MESVNVKNPKEEKILNQDDSVTNIESENSEEENDQRTPEKEVTLITDNDASGQIADANASNKGQGPSGENL